ncbi:MAG: hypothetical protein HYW06_03930 [Gemmatimonadetes bacterium]|nr:hypothetical protein [Gemmatimonadota bacterium]
MRLTDGWLRAWYATLGLVCGVPGALAAQAICSAPHSSPVLASGQALHTLPPGAGWFQVSAYHQVSDRYFGTGGERQPFLAQGEVTTRSAYFTGAVGIIRGIDLWAQFPILDVRYADQTGAREGSGLGDPRFSVRVGSDLIGVAVPLIPLSEGQRDWEISLESGTALQGVPLYVLGWIGYRWRQLNAEVDRKPGNERFAHLAAGGRVGAVQLEAAAEWVSGQAPRFLGVELPTAARRLVQLQPTLAYYVGPGSIELTGLIPVAGRNLPAGPGISAGYRVSWGPQ